MVTKWRKSENEPGRVELDEDVTLLVKHDLVELLANKVEDGLVLDLRDGLGLEFGLELVIQEERNLLLRGLRGPLLMLVVRVLELLLKVLDDKRGPLGLGEVQGTSVVGIFNSVNPDEVDLALVLRSDRPERIDVLLVLLIRGVNEEVGKRLGARRVSLVILCTDLIEEGNSKVTNPALEVLHLGTGDGIGVDRLWLVERTEYGDSWGSDTSSCRDLCISGETEEVVVTVFVRGGAELRGGGLRGRGQESDGDDLISLLELLPVPHGDLGYSGERLPVSNVCQT